MSDITPIKATERIDKLWGYERHIHTSFLGSSGYTGKMLTVFPNQLCSSLHYHRSKTETFLITRGCLMLEIWRKHNGTEATPMSNGKFTQQGDERWLHENTFRMEADDKITIPPLIPHRFWAGFGELAEFIEFSTPDQPSDSYRILLAGPAPK